MKKIVFCGLLYDRNLGDPLIMDAASFLYKQALAGVIEPEIDFADFYGRTGQETLWDEKQLNLMDRCLHYAFALLRRVFSGIHKPFSRRMVYARWRFSPNGMERSIRYFTRKFQGASLVVIAGGGVIEYNVHEYYMPLMSIVNAAQTMGIPVVFNAVGLVGNTVDVRDWRFKKFKSILNSRVVKWISVRDDVRAMNDKYLEPGRTAALVADPGVWIAEALALKKQENADLIGLGLIRGDSFRDYGIALGEDDIVSLWVDITKELDRRSHPWVFFCNGFEKDYQLGLKILSRLGISDIDSRLAKIPADHRELVQTISSFKAVICHRLHACIVSYSLDIPCIALSWNKKLEYFFDAAGYPERVFDAERLNASAIVDAMENAAAAGYDQERRSQYRQTIVDNIRIAARLVE